MEDNLKAKVAEFLESKLENFSVRDIKTEKIEHHRYSSIYYLSAISSSSNLDLAVKIQKPSSTLSKVRGEYDIYVELGELLRGTPFCTLDVLGYLESPPALISLRKEGIPVSSIMRGMWDVFNDKPIEDRLRILHGWFQEAGNILALYHKYYKAEHVEPGSFTHSIEHVIREKGVEAADILESAYYRHVRCYNDYSLWNILITKDNKLCIIDPPEEQFIELIYYDIAKFRISLTRACCHPAWFFSYGVSSSRALYDSFIKGYSSSFEIDFKQIDHLMVDIYELKIWGDLRAGMREQYPWHRKTHPKYIAKVLLNVFNRHRLNKKIRLCNVRKA